MKRTLLLFTIICTAFISVSAQNYENQMRIDSVDRSYLFLVTDATPHPHLTRLYFWFKSGRIHQTQGGYYGKLLHGVYKVTDKEQRLLQQGNFRMGRKAGTWLSWYENGQLKSRIRHRPRDEMQYIEIYDPHGKLLEKGYNKNGQFTGHRIEIMNDSAVTVRYENGIRHTSKKFDQP